jgi:hypothetical protein
MQGVLNLDIPPKILRWGCQDIICLLTYADDKVLGVELDRVSLVHQVVSSELGPLTVRGQDTNV